MCWTASPLCIFINSTNWICVGQLHRYASLSTLQTEFVLDSFIVMHLYQLYKLNLCWTASLLCIFINSTNWICVGQLHHNASLPTLQIEFVLDSSTSIHLYQLFNLLGELQTVGDPIDNRCCSCMKNKHPEFKLRKKQLRRNFIPMGARKP